MDHQHPARSNRGRASAGKIEWDEKFGLVKINPIADWSSRQVWQYIREHDLPYNPLHDLGYPSIGCTHCTRAVQPGEDAASRALAWTIEDRVWIAHHPAAAAAAATAAGQSTGSGRISETFQVAGKIFDLQAGSLLASPRSITPVQ